MSVLYGVGLGPGDPELMTLKAHRIVSSASVVAYPAPTGGESFARSIAAASIPKNAREIRMDVPMDVARFPAQSVYDTSAEEIAEVLEDGQDVVVLCAGDPFFYGSFMYLYHRLADRFTIEIIPGVTSMTTCAAVWQQPLCARNDVLSIVPGTLDEAELEARIEAADAVAILKVGRHIEKIRRVLDRLSLTEKAGYVERASLDNQKVVPLQDVPGKAPYFSMVLVTKGSDPWLR